MCGIRDNLTVLAETGSHLSYSTIVLGPDVFARQWGALRDRVDRQAALAEFVRRQGFSES